MWLHWVATPEVVGIGISPFTPPHSKAAAAFVMRYGHSFPCHTFPPPRLCLFSSTFAPTLWHLFSLTPTPGLSCCLCPSDAACLEPLAGAGVSGMAWGGCLIAQHARCSSTGKQYEAGSGQGQQQWLSRRGTWPSPSKRFGQRQQQGERKQHGLGGRRGKARPG